MSEGLHVAALSPEDAAWLGRWRTLPGLEACEAEGRVWVRGPDHEGWIRLPALERYTSDAEGRLKLPGGRVPLRRMPEVKWLGLADFLRARPLAPSLPAQFVAPVAWRLIPSDAFRDPSLLVLPWAEFATWCDRAPEIRMRELQFAVADDGRACVRGGPLPALQGGLWCVSENVATPAGWTLPRGITPALVVASLQLGSGELALVHVDGSAERLPREAFVPVTRTAVRATHAQSQQEMVE